MGKVTLGKSVEELKAEEQKKSEENKSEDKVESVKEIPKINLEGGLKLSLDETKFILAKLAQMEYKGVEIEFIYHLLQKLQNHLQLLLNKQK